MKLKRIQIDDNVFLFDNAAEARVTKQAQKALANGATVTWVDGTMEWETVSAIVDLHMSGSAMFTWDSAGNKVRHEVVRHTKRPDGTRSSTHIGYTWRKP